jgi:hypothetical protein
MKRKWILLIALIAVVLIGPRLLPRGKPAPSPAPAVEAPAVKPQEQRTVAAPNDLQKARDEVVAYFKNGEEPKVKDAVWTADDIFKVGVLDDGTDRSGYAQYVCEVLSERGLKGEKVWVQVIDVAKLVRTNKWEKLGDARCE